MHQSRGKRVICPNKGGLKMIDQTGLDSLLDKGTQNEYLGLIKKYGTIITKVGTQGFHVLNNLEEQGKVVGRWKKHAVAVEWRLAGK